ncbi:iron-containing alcohol dehydrogenase [Patescibacteria group bacterium]
MKAKNQYQYFLPTKIYFGLGSINMLSELVSQLKSKRPLLIVGEHFKKEKVFAKIVSFIKPTPLIYDCPIGKSDIQSIDKLAVFCQQKKPDLMIAIGGGTILDTAKAAAILETHHCNIEELVITGEKKVIKESVSLIAIPTTSGTGTEVTPFAVVWDEEKKKKYSLDSSLVYPKIALVDPELTINLPPQVTAYTGMDALTQAIEAYWSKNHNPISDIYALKAIELVMNNLEKAVLKSVRVNREMMSLGSLMAGLAFSNTKTTICHAVSYPITARWGIPHGHAVALTLPAFIKRSLPVLGKRQTLILKALGASNAQEAATKITGLMKKIGLETELSKLGIKKTDLKIIVKEGFDPDRAAHAPWVPTPEELKSILRKIL